MDSRVALTVVVAHPNLETSYCGALVRSVRQLAEDLGADVAIQDLYDDGFDPVLTAAEAAAVHGGVAVARSDDELVVAYQRRLAATDVLVVVHPNWWGKPPALMSGWIDRILAPGVAYKLSGGAAGTPEGLLRMSALVVTTGDTPVEREEEVFGDPLAAIWERCVLPYVGSEPVERIHISPVHALSPEALSGHLGLVAAAVRELLVAADPDAPSGRT